MRIYKREDLWHEVVQYYGKKYRSLLEKENIRCRGPLSNDLLETNQ
jgi:hypothetical protein